MCPGRSELGDVLRERADAKSFSVTERRGLLGQELVVFFLFFALALQGFLPACFERARHEPIFWLS